MQMRNRTTTADNITKATKRIAISENSIKKLKTTIELYSRGRARASTQFIWLWPRYHRRLRVNLSFILQKIEMHNFVSTLFCVEISSRIYLAWLSVEWRLKSVIFLPCRTSTTAARD